MDQVIGWKHEPEVGKGGRGWGGGGWRQGGGDGEEEKSGGWSCSIVIETRKALELLPSVWEFERYLGERRQYTMYG